MIFSISGFPRIREKVGHRGAFLVMPHFDEKIHGQFSQVENEENYVTAKLRVHVERCIKRKKEFKVIF